MNCIIRHSRHHQTSIAIKPPSIPCRKQRRFQIREWQNRFCLELLKLFCSYYCVVIVEMNPCVLELVVDLCSASSAANPWEKKFTYSYYHQIFGCSPRNWRQRCHVKEATCRHYNKDKKKSRWCEEQHLSLATRIIKFDEIVRAWELSPFTNPGYISYAATRVTLDYGNEEVRSPRSTSRVTLSNLYDSLFSSATTQKIGIKTWRIICLTRRQV